jgi:pyrroloquinoline quinone (PQQ) biosynthesis protein C
MGNGKRNYHAVIKQLDAIHATKPRSKHPLWIALMAGTLNRKQVAEHLRQFSAIPLYNHLFHGPLYVNCPDPRWRKRMAEVVFEEGTGGIYSNGIPHYELYLRLGKAFGITPDEMYSTPLCAGSTAIRAYLAHMSSRSFLEGMSALSLGAEAQVPGVSGKVSQTMMDHYGLSRDDAMFYIVHEEADKDHSSGALEFLERFATTDEDVETAIRAVRDTVELSWLMYEDIWRCVQSVQ